VLAEGHQAHWSPHRITHRPPTRPKGRRHPPISPKSATRGIASTGPKKLALMSRLIGLPRWAGEKWSAMAAMLFGGIIAAPTPVRRRHASNAP
jgi:hypothetical protein